MDPRRVVALGLLGLMLAACRTAPPEPASARLQADPPEHIEAPPPSEPPSLAEVVPAVATPAMVLATESPSVEPEPEPDPFPGQDTVSLSELVTELDRIADEIALLPAVRADYEALVADHGLRDAEPLYRDYVRVKLAFEATRGGGLWHLRWGITNEKPNSEQIWKQWRKAPPPDDADPRPTAVAECDELSALFAFVARKLGVRHIGLLWPQWNHVVAVWTVQSEDDSPVRIVVPTSQIFLTDQDSLGTDGFDPWTQKTIYEYRRRDVKDTHRIDAELARFFVQQARRYAGLPQAELQRLRNERDLSMAPG